MPEVPVLEHSSIECFQILHCFSRIWQRAQQHGVHACRFGRCSAGPVPRGRWKCSACWTAGSSRGLSRRSVLQIVERL